MMTNPLREKECNDLDCVLATIPNLRDTIAAMEECGMPCQEEKEQMEKQEAWATAVKRKFNPLAT